MPNLTPSEAYSIASQYGSYMHDGDSGAVFYTFPAGRAEIEDEDHRQALIAYTRECLAGCNPEGTAELNALLRYFEKAHTDADPVWWCSSDGRIELQLTREQASNVSQPGKDAADDVAGLMRVPGLAAQLEKIKDADMVRELKGYGAWDEDELTDRDTNLSRLVWLAGCAIDEGQFDSEDDEDEAQEIS